MLNENAIAPEVLAVPRDDGAVWITIKRPQKHNALAGSVLAAVKAAVLAASADPQAKVLLLRGAGERFFAAGGDLVELDGVRSAEEVAAMVADSSAALDAIRQCPLPVVAYLNGDALGGGAELALACDMRMLSARARIGFIQARLAITPAWGGSIDLCQVIGPSRALRMMTRCEMVGAEQALAWGLVDAVIDDGDARDAQIDAFVKPLTERPAHVLRGLKAQTSAWRQTVAYAERRVLEAQHLTTAWLHDDHWRAAEQILSREKR